MLFSFKSKAPELPSGWPSPLHNKCNRLDCRFPNPPQPAKGVYDCRGIAGGFYCEGTYNVSSDMAREANKYYKKLFHQQAEEERLLKENRQNENRLRRRMDRGQGNVVPGKNGYHEDALRMDSPQQNGLVRRDAVRKRLQPGMSHPRVERWNQIKQDRREKEYLEDQRLQQRYPGYNVPHRWI